MRPIRISFVIACVLSITAMAVADERSTIGGLVRDRNGGAPLEGANVFVAGPDGRVSSAVTDRDGRYTIVVAPGTYDVVFVHGKSRSKGRIAIGAGQHGRLDGKVAQAASEVIVLEEPPPPVVRPTLKKKTRKLPPYSDRAIESDAWTRAWFLLEIDERGAVTRVKMLRKPGFDLDDIAVDEAFKLSFTPARDAQGQPMRVWIVWGFEWPAQSFVVGVTGLANAMPPDIDLPARRADWYIPCAGSGPFLIGSAIYKGYKDCSEPDLSAIETAPWIARK